MKLEFKSLDAHDIQQISKYFGLRPNKACESVPFDYYLWRDFYKTKFAIYDNTILYITMTIDGKTYAAVPYCDEKNLKDAFYRLETYFDEVLNEPFAVYLVDEDTMQMLELDLNKYTVKEEVDLKDYLYSGDKLRTLSGNSMHKKKNQLNKFMREYEGRYYYRRLNCLDRDAVKEFLNTWDGEKIYKLSSLDYHLDYELNGIYRVLDHCKEIKNVIAGGVFIDNKLEAYTIGSYNELENMAIIHVEKANYDFQGIYQYINREFLINEYPYAILVNREDDLGLESLRASKLSYKPIGYAHKYNIYKNY